MTVVVSVLNDHGKPLHAPYRVSAKSAHADVDVTIDVTGTGPVHAYRMMRDSAAIIQGTELAMIGGICGISRCGNFAPTAIPTPAHFTEPIAAAELHNEGSHQIGLYVYNGELFE